MAQRGVARGRVAMDLKLSILSALNKLADRDTQQIAMDELVKIAESLQPDGISVFLGCLYEISPDQKSVVRREGVKLVSALASLYGDLLTPHLQKIISALIRRLKEPDSNIRDACVDAIGTLVAHVQAPASLANPAAAAAGAGGGNADHVALSGPVGVFTKPLFDTLNEQTRSVQIGAAMCLARALDNAPELPTACTQRLCLKILKFLNSPSFNAKPALLPALGGLSRASGGAMNQHLGIVITCLQESLQSSDWATRKAAADTFGAVALSVGGAPLINFKSSTMALLDSYRFDKVKPARESVIDAIHIWKNVPDPPVVDASPTRTVSTKSNDSTGTLKTAASRKYLTADSRSCSPTVSSSVASHAIADKGSVKKKSPSQAAAAAAAAAERKANLDFFRKLSIRNSDDWQIEVAVPRGSPPASHNKENHEETQVMQPVEKVVVVSKTNSSSNNNSSHGGGGEVHEEKEKLAFKALVDKFEAVEVKVAKEEISNGRSLNTNGSNSFAANGWSHHHHQQQQQQQNHQPQQQHQHQHQQAAENGEVTEQQRKSSAGGDLVSIGRQLSQLEKGQSELMEMLQEFMGNSQENTQTLESRVERLERALEEMARKTAAAIGLEDMARITAAASVGNARPPPSSYFSGNEGNESSRASKEQQQQQHHQQQQFNSRNITRHCEAETWNDNLFRGNRGGNEGLLVEQSSSSKQQQLQQKTWENQRSLVSGFVGRLGEGPSARSVWRASKDEATLAAIRVAGAGEAAAEADKLLLPSSARSGEVSGSSKNSLDQIQGTNNANSGGGGGGGGWNVWGRAMESLQSGDLDCAYEEVICGGDELLLVRLMNRTGPVLEQLSSETVGEMLRSICQFLQQPSFVDAALPWIRQVTEMVRTNGPKCLGVSGEVKKELLASLQEASMLEFPERWMGSAVGKMANQLGNSWVDLQA